MTSRIQKTGVVLLILCLVAWWIRERTSGSGSGQAFPRKPVHVVVPYPAGGGSDTFVRILQKGMLEENLLPQPVAVFNHPGGSGTIGSRKVKDAKPNGYTILCSHNAVITAKLSGTVNFGAEAFEPICLTGTMAMVIIVREDSPYPDLPALLEEAKRRPREITFGANQGAPAYFTTLQLQKCVPGSEFSIVSADGGADRYARIIGGHLDAGIFSLSEYLDFRRPDDTPSSQNVRALVLLSRKRHEAIPDVPTSGEQDIPVFSQNANYWFAPKGTPAPVIDYLADRLREAMQIESVRRHLHGLHIDPDYMSGEEFHAYLEENEEQFLAVAARKRTNLPDFPLWVAGLSGILFFWVLIERLRTRQAPPRMIPIQRRTAAAGILLLGLYVSGLQSGWLPFAPATAVLVLTFGGMICRWKRDQWFQLVSLALITALGTELIFTKVFSVALP